MSVKKKQNSFSVRAGRRQQCFSFYETRYRLDEELGRPVEEVSPNLQELVNSAYDDSFYSKLESMFDTYVHVIPATGDVDVYIDDYGKSNLDRLESHFSEFGELCDRYGIATNMSYCDALDALRVAIRMKQDANREEVKNIEKKNETQTVPEQ